MPRASLREGQWKLIPGRKAGEPAELYNLAEDIGESRNVAQANPQVTRDMLARLDKLRAAGRSRP